MEDNTQNPFNEFAASHSDEEIEALLREYATSRTLPFSVDGRYESYSSYFCGNLSGAPQETIDRFYAVAGDLAEKYLDEEPLNVHLLGGVLHLFDNTLEIDRRKLIRAMGKLKKGTMCETEWGCSDDLYRSLMFELAINQEGCDETEREYLMEFWNGEIQDLEYAVAAFEGIIQLDESRLPEAYERLKASGVETDGVDFRLCYDNLDIKYGITLSSPGIMEAMFATGTKD